MAALTPSQALDMIHRSMLTGVPTSEFNAAGGYDAVYDLARSSGGDMGRPTDAAIIKYGPTIAAQGYGNLSYAPGNTVNDSALADAGYDNYYDQATKRKSSTYFDKQIGLLNTKYGTLNTSFLDLQNQLAALKTKNTGTTSSTGTTALTGGTSLVGSGATNTAGLGGTSAGGLNATSSSGAVYGPDGTAYPSPAAAIAAGVYNYTMFPPTGSGQPAGLVTNAMNTTDAAKLSGVTGNYYGGVNQNPDNPWVNLYPT